MSFDDNFSGQGDNSGMDKKAAREKYDRIKEQILTLLHKRFGLTEDDKDELERLSAELKEAETDEIRREEHKKMEKFAPIISEAMSFIEGGEIEVYEHLKEVKRKAEEGDADALAEWKKKEKIYNRILNSWVDKRGAN